MSIMTKTVAACAMALCLAACATVPPDSTAAKCAELHAKLAHLREVVRNAKAKATPEQQAQLDAMEANAERLAASVCGPY